jgi:hypothetical protein
MHKKIVSLIVIALFSLTLCEAMVTASAAPVRATNVNGVAYVGSVDEVHSRSGEPCLTADSNLIGGQAWKKPTMLTATANKTKVRPGELFTISGRLTSLLGGESRTRGYVSSGPRTTVTRGLISTR